MGSGKELGAVMEAYESSDRKTTSDYKTTESDQSKNLSSHKKPPSKEHLALTQLLM